MQMSLCFAWGRKKGRGRKGGIKKESKASPMHASHITRRVTSAHARISKHFPEQQQHNNKDDSIPLMTTSRTTRTMTMTKILSHQQQRGQPRPLPRQNNDQQLSLFLSILSIVATTSPPRTSSSSCCCSILLFLNCVSALLT